MAVLGGLNPQNLKSLLAAGEITQEEYDAKMQKLKKLKGKAKSEGKKRPGLLDWMKS